MLYSSLADDMLKYGSVTILISCARFSTITYLGHFKDSAKLKGPDKLTVNKYQKPIALFSKHLKMAATSGATIIDVTAGTGTTAVRWPCSVNFAVNFVDPV